MTFPGELLTKQPAEDVQKGRPAKPQQEKRRGVCRFHPPPRIAYQNRRFPGPFVEALSDARTKLEALFNILLSNYQHRTRRMLHDSGRHAAEQEAPDGPQSFRAGHDEVGLAFLSDIQYLVRRIAQLG